MRFSEMCSLIEEAKHTAEEAVRELSNNIQLMTSLEVVQKVRAVTDYLSRAKLDERLERAVEHLMDVLKLHHDRQVWTAGQELWMKLEMAKNRRLAD